MIRHIRGTVIEVQPTSIVVDVHGIGYMVYTTAKTGYQLNEEIELHMHLAVRENALDLYGFSSAEELHFFELLLTLPKIGPKSALQILSQTDVAHIRSAILFQDPTPLSKMYGMSKKTAEKIVLGLKDKFDDVQYMATEAHAQPTSSSAFISDTIDALITLGYPQHDARDAVQKLHKEKPEITDVGEAIKEVLLYLHTNVK